MEPTNIIELNGKRYDAISGTYLGPSNNPAHQSAGRAKTIDGVVLASSHGRVKQGPAPYAPTKVKPTVKRAAPKHAARRPEHTKTLMRHAVAKPKQTATKLKPHLDITQAPKHTIALKQSVANIHPARRQRAHHTPQHRNVQRFNHLAAERTAPITRSPIKQTERKPASSAAPPIVHPTAVQQSPDIFEVALAQARSHEQTTPRAIRQRSRRARALRLTFAALAIVIVGGLTAWTQKAHIEVKVASWQAGFNAQVPSYALVGYEHGSIRHEHGQIHITYHSGDSSYRVTQQISDWNSQTLRDQGIAGVGTNDFTTVENKGRIIYINGNNASWVDGGVRYDITGNAPLKTDDIIRIAEGL